MKYNNIFVIIFCSKNSSSELSVLIINVEMGIAKQFDRRTVLGALCRARDKRTESERRESSVKPNSWKTLTSQMIAFTNGRI